MDGDNDMEADGAQRFHIILQTDDDIQTIKVSPDASVEETVREALSLPDGLPLRVILGGQDIETIGTFDENGIEEGARLQIDVEQDLDQARLLAIIAKLESQEKTFTAKLEAHERYGWPRHPHSSEAAEVQAQNEVLFSRWRAEADQAMAAAWDEHELEELFSNTFPTYFVKKCLEKCQSTSTTCTELKERLKVAAERAWNAEQDFG